MKADDKIGKTSSTKTRWKQRL